MKVKNKFRKIFCLFLILAITIFLFLFNARNKQKKIRLMYSPAEVVGLLKKVNSQKKLIFSNGSLNLIYFLDNVYNFLPEAEIEEIIYVDNINAKRGISAGDSLGIKLVPSENIKRIKEKAGIDFSKLLFIFLSEKGTFRIYVRGRGRGGVVALNEASRKTGLSQEEIVGFFLSRINLAGEILRTMW